MGGNNTLTARKTNHFYFGQVTKKKYFNKDVISVTKPIIDKQQFYQWKQKYQTVKIMTNKQSLLVPQSFDYRKIQYKGINCCCGAQAQTQMTYEDSSFTLYQQIRNRKQLKRQYTQQQLLLLFYKLIEAGKQFQKKGIKIGDIRTKNMFVTKGNDVKMINVASFPGQHTSIDKFLYGNLKTYKFYFAPEQIDYVQSASPAKADLPNPKTESWSIGLCLLQAATLQCSQDLYQMPIRKIKSDLLRNRLNQTMHKYHTLYEFLIMIVKMDSSTRSTSGECWASMKPYAEKITQLQPFKRNPAAEATSVRKYFTEGSGRR